MSSTSSLHARTSLGELVRENVNDRPPPAQRTSSSGLDPSSQSCSGPTPWECCPPRLLPCASMLAVPQTSHGPRSRTPAARHPLLEQIHEHTNRTRGLPAMERTLVIPTGQRIKLFLSSCVPDHQAHCLAKIFDFNSLLHEVDTNRLLVRVRPSTLAIPRAHTCFTYSSIPNDNYLDGGWEEAGGNGGGGGAGGGRRSICQCPCQVKHPHAHTHTGARPYALSKSSTSMFHYTQVSPTLYPSQRNTGTDARQWSGSFDGSRTARDGQGNNGPENQILKTRKCFQICEPSADAGAFFPACTPNPPRHVGRGGRLSRRRA